MSDSGFSLHRIADRVPEVRGALVFEASGIEVSSWGEADPEVNSAEFAQLLGTVAGLESLLPTGAPRELALAGERGQWLLFALGAEYVLAVLVEPAVPLGKVRFYAGEWIARHRGDFI